MVRRILTLAGFPILDLTQDEIPAVLVQAKSRNEPVLLCFANHNFIMTCSEFYDDLMRVDPIILNDGVAVDVMALCLHGRRFAANLNGTDLSPFLMKTLTGNWRVACIGARDQRAAHAGRRLTENTGHTLVLALNGYDDLKDPAHFLPLLRDAKPDLVFLAFGDPKQSLWFLKHRDALPSAIYCGVGALFDFYSGSVKRAPMWMRVLRLEWLHRLLLDPLRLANRYSLGFLSFVWICLRNRRKTFPPARQTAP